MCTCYSLYLENSSLYTSKLSLLLDYWYPVYMYITIDTSVCTCMCMCHCILFHTVVVVLLSTCVYMYVCVHVCPCVYVGGQFQLKALTLSDSCKQASSNRRPPVLTVLWTFMHTIYTCTHRAHCMCSWLPHTMNVHILL